MEVTGRTRLTVLIPTHGRPALLGRTLASLAECIIPEGYVETVVVENGPKSGAEDTVAAASSQWPHLKLRYLHVSRANKSHALNEAMRSMDEGLVVFLDDDVRVDNDVLRAYSDAARSEGSGYFFGGPTKSDFERRPASWRFGTLPVSARGWTLQENEDPFFLGFNWAVWMRDFERVGGFDVNRGPGSPTGSTGQESDMQRRLKSSGVKPLYVADALVWHYVPRERSSVTWALKRAYRVGVEKGLNGGDHTKGASRSSMRFRFISFLRGGTRCMFNLLRARPDQAWRALDQICRDWGVARGASLRGNH